MLELSGKISDGVVLNYCVSPDYNDMALEQIEKGAKEAGRTLDEIDLLQLVVCSVDPDEDKARHAAKWLLTQYLAQQPHIAKASNTPQSIVEKIQSILGWPATKEQVEEAMQHVPDELVDRISASGTPEQAKAKVQKYINHGCTCPILYPMADNVQLMIDTFSGSGVQGEKLSIKT